MCVGGILNRYFFCSCLMRPWKICSPLYISNCFHIICLYNKTCGQINDRVTRLERNCYIDFLQKFDTLLVLCELTWNKRENRNRSNESVFLPTSMSITAIDEQMSYTYTIYNDLANYYSMKHKIKHDNKILALTMLLYVLAFRLYECPLVNCDVHVWTKLVIKAHKYICFCLLRNVWKRIFSKCDWNYA